MSKQLNDSAASTHEFEEGLAKFDKLLEHRSRLAICALLRRYEKVAFRRFKELLKESDGNLGAQLRKLEDAGYISVEKTFEDRRPVSWYSLTASGGHALKQHLEGLESVLASD